MTSSDIFVPEWAPQDAVLITWPTEHMDWAYILPEVERTYVEIARAVLRYEALIVICSDAAHVREMIGSEGRFPLITIGGVEANDTWARDFAPLSRVGAGGKSIVDFGFNAWGMKFAASVDNTISRRLYHDFDIFADDVAYLNALDFICEGGALETDGRGTLLSTASVLCEANRNPNTSLSEQKVRLHHTLGTPNVHVLNVEAMEGDDTDGHIDTLARFCDPHTIVYNYSADPIYGDLDAFRAEVEALRDRDGEAYRYYPLPIPSPTYDEDGMMLPATYANFLIINGAVLVPIYGAPEDKEALEVLRPLFPEREVIGIDCRSLVKQHGSLHCITMQFPQGFIHPDLLK